MSVYAERPPKCERPAPPQDRPTFASPNADDHVTAMRLRRAASRRLPVLACGHADPLDGSHRGAPNPWGYPQAAAHLAAAGLLSAPPVDLDELRAMWRNADTRELAGAIARGWAVTA